MIKLHSRKIIPTYPEWSSSLDSDITFHTKLGDKYYIITTIYHFDGTYEFELNQYRTEYAYDSSSGDHIYRYTDRLLLATIKSDVSINTRYEKLNYLKTHLEDYIMESLL